MNSTHMLANELTHKLNLFVTETKARAKGGSQPGPSNLVTVEMRATILVYSLTARFSDLMEQDSEFQHGLPGTLSG